MEETYKKIISEQYIKCLKDPIHFIKNYCYVQHPVKGKILFDLYDFQEKTLKDIMENKDNIILKARQLGISTLSAAYSLWLMLFHGNKKILVIAIKEEVAKNLIEKIEFMNKNLPSWLKVKLVQKNRAKRMKFVNGSEVKAVAATKDAGRSEALSLLIIDEMAFIPNNILEDIWTAAKPTLDTGGRALLLSTPNGKGNKFYTLYRDAESQKNGYNWIRLPWNVHPERTQAWRDQEDIEHGVDKAAQENDCSFLSSGRSVIDYKVIEAFKQKYQKDPIEQRYNKELWIWELPKQGSTYVIAADVARGDGGDYSAFHVIDALNARQVAEYRGKVETSFFASMLYSIASEYNDGLLVVENAAQGWAVLDHLRARNYKNLYFSIKGELSLSLNLEELMRKTLDDKYEPVPGWTTSKKTRSVIIENMKKFILSESVEIRSSRTIAELDTFIWSKSGKQEAEIGYNDDLVISLAIGLWVREIALKLKTEGLELSKAILNKITTTHNSGFYNRRNSDDPWFKEVKGQEINLREWIQ